MHAAARNARAVDIDRHLAVTQHAQLLVPVLAGAHMPAHILVRLAEDGIDARKSVVVEEKLIAAYEAPLAVFPKDAELTAIYERLPKQAVIIEIRRA